MERGAEPPLHAALCTLDLSPDFVEPRAPVCSGWPYNAPVLERFDARTDGRARLSVALSFVWCFAAPAQRPLRCQKLWELCWCQFGSIVVNRYAKTGTLPLPDYLLRRRGAWKKFSRIKIVSHTDKMEKKKKWNKFLMFSLGERLWEWVLSVGSEAAVTITSDLESSNCRKSIEVTVVEVTAAAWALVFAVISTLLNTSIFLQPMYLCPIFNMSLWYITHWAFKNQACSSVGVL